MSLKRIILYGHLRKRFGRCFEFAVNSPAEAIRALCSQVEGFAAYLREHSEPGYRVLVGEEVRDVEGLQAPMGREVIKIVPVVVGAKSSLGKVATGVALMVAAYWTGGASMSYMSAVWGASTAATVGAIGTAMMLSGVAELLASPPAYVNPLAEAKTESDPPAYSFSGPHMTVGQGNPVPVLLGGPLRIGGALVSMGISAEEWPTKGLGGLAPDELGTRGGDGDVSPWVWAVKPA